MSNAWYKGLTAAGIVWLGLLWGVPAARQSLVFYESGAEAFCDYRMPQMCVASEKVYEPEGLSRVDAPYPAFGYAVAKAFPSDVLKGGILVFLAWKDERGWKKGIAFLALAAASALKIIPAAFGLLLVKERRWRDCVVLAALGAAFFFVPFVWIGGREGFGAFLENLRMHADHYGLRCRFGLVPFDRSLRLLMGMPKESVCATYALDRVLANVAFLLVVGMEFWSRHDEERS